MALYLSDCTCFFCLFFFLFFFLFLHLCYTVKLLNCGTPKNFAIIYLKFKWCTKHADRTVTLIRYMYKRTSLHKNYISSYWQIRIRDTSPKTILPKRHFAETKLCRNIAEIRQKCRKITISGCIAFQKGNIQEYLVYIFYNSFLFVINY